MLIPKSKMKMIKLVQVSVDRYSNTFHLREIVVNSAHIVSIVDDIETAGQHANGHLPEGLHEAQQFSKITFTNGKEITAVGTPEAIGKKTKNILHG